MVKYAPITNKEKFLFGTNILSKFKPGGEIVL